MTPLISLKDIRKTFVNGDVAVEVLRGVSLDIQPGEFVAIVGASGSGKSTLMNILGCLDTPTGGQYLLEGEDVSDLNADELAARRRQMFGFVFQSYNLVPTATAQENVEIPAIYAGMPSLAAGRACQHAFALASSRRPSRSPAQPAVRRPAAARVDRPRTDERRSDHPRRRTDRRTRQPERQGSDGDAAADERGRSYRHHHHPRPGTGRIRRPRHRDQRRPDLCRPYSGQCPAYRPRQASLGGKKRRQGCHRYRCGRGRAYVVPGAAG